MPGRAGTAPAARRQTFFFAGTLAPALRALLKPIAMACLRLATGLPDLPLFSSPVYTFDIRVQGEGETVFFDV